MKILRKIIFGLIMAANSAVLCNEEPTAKVENKFNYWGVGVGIPTFFSAKLGHRVQIDRLGYEYGIGVTPLVFVTEGHVFGSFLFYPSPNLSGQTYLGLGLRAGGVFERSRSDFGYLSPGFLIGREYETCSGTRRFVQVGLSPGGLTIHGLKQWTSISLTFGYGF